MVPWSSLRGKDWEVGEGGLVLIRWDSAGYGGVKHQCHDLWPEREGLHGTSQACKADADRARDGPSSVHRKETLTVPWKIRCLGQTALFREARRQTYGICKRLADRSRR
jgi:hypothetical protein